MRRGLAAINVHTGRSSPSEINKPRPKARRSYEVKVTSGAVFFVHWRYDAAATLAAGKAGELVGQSTAEETQPVPSVQTRTLHTTVA